VSLWSWTFGKSRSAPHAPVLDRAPANAVWRSVRPKPGVPVRAELAQEDGEVDTARGPLRYEAGQHYIVEHGPDDRAPVRRDIFKRTYRLRDDGLYEKRTNIVLRYFRLSHPVMVQGLEGPELAHPGDWIMEGSEGELWPVAPEDALAKYEHVES
jgi:hypothetical protein